MFHLRDYQQKASDAAVGFFKSKRKSNAVIVLPTGAGKSLCIADIANRLHGHTLVFQPSKEILEQNYNKIRSLGVTDCSIYSASFNSKEISRITFATIGSVIKHKEDFAHFDNIIIDECHLVASNSGMYKEFITATEAKVLGLTATPYRLTSYFGGAMLKMITRTRPRIFSNIIYQVQVSELLERGYLAKLNYYQLMPPKWDDNRLKSNTTGQDFTEQSVKEEYQRVDFYGYLVSIIERLQKPKNGEPRKGILVFTRFLEEAEQLVQSVESCAIVSGSTPKAERERVLADFKNGKIKVVANVGVLTTGFDYPELDTIVIARPTKSLSLYYQIVGRAIRPHEGKQGWIVDLCGNVRRFGKVEDLKLVEPKKSLWEVQSGQRRLTNVMF